MGLLCMGHLLALDAERTLDDHHLVILQPLFACAARSGMERDEGDMDGHHRICDRDVYLRRRRAFDEKFP